MAKKVTKKKAPAKKKAKTAKKTTRKSSATAAAKTKAAAKTVVVESAPARVAPVIVNDELIRARAFEIYRSGRNPNNPDADWFQAVRELELESAQ